MITKSNYDNQVLSSMDLDLQLRTNINNYNILKQEIEKTWITLS
ncbi:hypothetical protein [Clostridium beijerinckii]|jgi:hypothetical protein|nr:hypothetical protein [Clostridium beijerinckii]NRT26321.1 hypothetical protein [Clostridium beijerinckii]NRT66072.1 hypothetical protein [Clostridium beijerinckii]NRT82418.1 hypothetical protein [Clostridium beijerinckii]NRU50880.1 hypothetical protein [Clostridium beijerinckii]NRZ30979.1 hypothetical protein [Clostridium beijerinckii]